MITKEIIGGINGLLYGISQINTGLSDELVSEAKESINSLIDMDSTPDEKTEWLSKLCNNYEFLSPLKEVLFDLIMINHLSSLNPDTQEDYLESKAWDDILDNTADFGSEALNIFLYLQEAKDTEAIPSLDDFLEEYLFVFDEDNQEEFEVYEPLVANSDLIEEALGSIITDGTPLFENTDLEGIAIPMLCFFKDIDNKERVFEKIAAYAPNDPVLFPLTACFYGYYQA